jgi:NAD+ diphosphatase
MLGCVARAKTSDIKRHDEELEDARWFDAREVQAAFQASLSIGRSSPRRSSGPVVDDVSSVLKFIPPPLAIAHHMIKVWLEKQPRALSPRGGARL